jgi:hypothetical protein
LTLLSERESLPIVPKPLVGPYVPRKASISLKYSSNSAAITSIVISSLLNSRLEGFAQLSQSCTVSFLESTRPGRWKVVAELTSGELPEGTVPTDQLAFLVGTTADRDHWAEKRPHEGRNSISRGTHHENRFCAETSRCVPDSTSQRVAALFKSGYIPLGDPQHLVEFGVGQDLDRGTI